MSQLRYERYLAQGGDFGAFVSPDPGRVAADHVIGVHVNPATMGFIRLGGLDEDTMASLTDTEKARAARLGAYMSDGNGYFQIQATRPNTLGFALTDSPAGQRTGTGASSAQLYCESMRSGRWAAPSAVPTGVEVFAEDVSVRRFAEASNNIVHWTDFDEGGHFAAMEKPGLLVGDLCRFRSALR
jgi:epoxide hydrolase